MRFCNCESVAIKLEWHQIALEKAIIFYCHLLYDDDDAAYEIKRNYYASKIRNLTHHAFFNKTVV